MFSVERIDRDKILLMCANLSMKCIKYMYLRIQARAALSLDWFANLIWRAHSGCISLAHGLLDLRGYLGVLIILLSKFFLKY